MDAPLPPDETARLSALYGLRVLDEGPAPHLDRLTRIAQTVFDVPIALVSLVDANRQWFASRRGLDATETPRCDAFCAHTILGPQMLVIPDARADVRFRENPLVTGAPHIRFYAGAPVAAPTGERLGTLCLIDRRPREFDASQQELLRHLADAVEREFEIAGLALTDPLTGLSNRLAVEEAGQRLLDLCRRRMDPLSVLFLDVDGLKAVNDTFGHQAGDTHLMRVAEVLRRTLRSSDIVARLAGDEFVAVLPDVGIDGAMAAADHIEQALAEATAEHPDRPPLDVSVGMSTVREEETFTELLRRADAEMYSVKQLRKADARALSGA